MSRTERLQLPWPPSVNTYWRRGANVTYMSQRGREFREEAMDAAYDQLGSFRPMEGRLSMVIELHPPTKRKFDVDNHAKGVLDALQHVGLIPDDEQVDLLVLQKHLSKGKPGHCDVTIATLTEH